MYILHRQAINILDEGDIQGAITFTKEHIKDNSLGNFKQNMISQIAMKLIFDRSPDRVVAFGNLHLAASLLKENVYDLRLLSIGLKDVVSDLADFDIEQAENLLKDIPDEGYKAQAQARIEAKKSKHM
jgi:hypothetical protein